ncbi:MAG: hypothetical protein A3F35_01855 [Candidatus Woykebacteria bacterium RIFCSPHIGHO2_12_FULL_45_10]|uniref:Uncharacterized protein n=1 Tax=Candidatus Woykebacteria bacterium RIFCSPHIGHO2_12_FULL_45_10 TaxID=1802603 RepID=A0A1G1WTE6_9BACT|nr:MAG: hypothetical protein A3F35_01855 [Candidatus Woykebacteria bacterium RIFCSPHIGHO2_12_FULL_45_10]
MPKNLANILALTLVTLLLWVTLQIFQITTRSSIPAATQKQLEKLDPNLDKNLIQDLNNPEKTVK